MNFEYFTDSDTLVLEFKRGRVHETFDVTQNVLAHVDADGSIMGLEFDLASKYITNIDLTSDTPNITWSVNPKAVLEPVTA